MRNPWLSLPYVPPYVLKNDAEAIKKHNLTAKSEHVIELNMLPEPFLGRPDAPVILLNLNPGVGQDDVQQHKELKFITLSRQNLIHLENVDFPFYLINPEIQDSPGYEWWFKRLRSLIEDCGHQRVANNVLCVELFPYHSIRYKALTVESQDYSFYLVREAMKRNAVIIQMRSREKWFSHVPELQTYDNRYELSSVQAPYVTLKNCPDGYDKAVTAILGNGN